jgi:hypothetical protein
MGTPATVGLPGPSGRLVRGLPPRVQGSAFTALAPHAGTRPRYRAGAFLPMAESRASAHAIVTWINLRQHDALTSPLEVLD